jgi:membrane protease YdiL (CAAX protease family)
VRQRFFLLLSIAIVGAYWAATVTSWALGINLIWVAGIRDLVLRYSLIAAAEIVVIWLLLRGAGQRLVDLGCRPRDFRRALHPDVARVIGFAVLLSIAVSLLHNILAAAGIVALVEPGPPAFLRALGRDPHDLPWWVSAAFLAGVIEELERAFCLTRFEHAFGKPGLGAAILIDSATFGLRHAYQGPDGIAHAAIMGVVWCLLFLRRRRVADPILAHVGFDLLMIPALYAG